MINDHVHKEEDSQNAYAFQDVGKNLVLHEQ